jgi:hypothetical protein
LVSLKIQLRRHAPSKKHAERTVLLREFSGTIPVMDPEGALKIMEHLNKSLAEVFQDAREALKPSLKPTEPTNES